MNPGIKTRLVSSLEKIFPEQKLSAREYCKATAFQGETFSFQVAYKSESIIKDISVEVESPLTDGLKVRETGLSPAELVSFSFDDGNYLKKGAGLFPDPLYDINGNRLPALPPFQWRCVWITVSVPRRRKGIFPVKVTFKWKCEDVKYEQSETFNLEVLSERLPPQKIIHSEWFHADCIATLYDTEAWSQKHWSLLRKYFKNAAGHGINMILTPIFTPPLDTAIGGERPTVQLIDVKKEKNNYDFDFSRLKKWISLLDECGIEYIEISHLFTQWGAKHAPKIIVSENGSEKKIFGWNTDAGGKEYIHFLNCFFEDFLKFAEDEGIGERCIFHISDEPSLEHLEQYKKAHDIVYPYIKGFKHIEALSKYEFYEKGLVKTPIIANNHLKPFIDNKVKGFGTYYCCAQCEKVPNRFFAMPSARNRIIGIMLYIYECPFFMHWGYNFWYSQYSINRIDPFKVTDAGRAFPAGDAFLVYPGKNGPVDSVRHEVLREAFQDLRALELLESLSSREKVIELIQEGLDYKLTMENYPASADWLLELREKINSAIEKLS